MDLFLLDLWTATIHMLARRGKDELIYLMSLHAYDVADV